MHSSPQILPKRHDLACTNCNTKVTTIWRRYPSGEMVCNACGLYYRLHCRPRPVSMRRDNIHPRKRRPKASGPGERSKRECHEGSASPESEDLYSRYSGYTIRVGDESPDYCMEETVVETVMPEGASLDLTMARSGERFLILDQGIAAGR